jgi:negative regulator of sigma E activity
MNTRIERALDGELAREDLTDAEKAELEREESLIRSVLRAVPAGDMPDLSAAVLRRIEGTGLEDARKGPRAAPLRQAGAWMWNPHQIRVRPAYAVAALMLLAFGLLLRTPEPAADPVAAVQPSQVLIQFRLDAPDAQQVALAGDFTGWQAEYQLTRTAPGVWTIVVPLQQGVHEYAFIVDGNRWTPDPLAPAVQDGFGGTNSRVAVLGPDSRSL